MLHERMPYSLATREKWAIMNKNKFQILFDTVCRRDCVTEMSKETKYARIYMAAWDRVHRWRILWHNTLQRLQSDNNNDDDDSTFSRFFLAQVKNAAAKRHICAYKKEKCFLNNVYTLNFYRCSWQNMSTLKDCILSFSIFLASHVKTKILINYICVCVCVQRALFSSGTQC